MRKLKKKCVNEKKKNWNYENFEEITMSCDDPTFNQTLCQNVTNAGNVQIIKFMSW